MRLAGSALVVLLAGSACGGPGPANLRPSPTASAVASATQSPTPSFQSSPEPTATATPTATLPLVPLGFSCRLPIFRPFSGSANPPPVVGFWSLPDGGLSFAPVPAYPKQGGGGDKPYGFYYDRAFSRWLPAPRTAVSPDGKHYAYMLRGEALVADKDVLHIVDVATSRDHSYPAVPAGSTPERYTVLDYASEGIYLGLAYEGPIWGLSMMDPNTGVIRKVADLGYLYAIDGSAVWLGSVNPADPNPQLGLGVQPDSIDRFDLVTGVRTTWLYLPGMAVWVVAEDLAGHPIVEAGSSVSGDAELLLLTGPGTAQPILKGVAAQLGVPSPSTGFGGPIADGHGVWFGSANGIYLYSSTGGFQKVSDLGFYPGNGCI